MPKRSDDWVAETWERLLDSAQYLAKLRGYSGFTTRELCDTAALSMGALYDHFQNRDDLIRSCIQLHVDAGIHRPVWGRLRVDDPALVQLEELMRGHTWAYGGRWGYELCALEVAAWGEHVRNPGLTEPFVADLAELLVVLWGILRDGQRTGEIERHLFAPAAAEALAATLLGLALLRRLGWRYTPRRMGDALTVLLRGLAPAR